MEHIHLLVFPDIRFTPRSNGIKRSFALYLAFCHDNKWPGFSDKDSFEPRLPVDQTISERGDDDVIGICFKITPYHVPRPFKHHQGINRSNNYYYSNNSTVIWNLLLDPYKLEPISNRRISLTNHIIRRCTDTFAALENNANLIATDHLPLSPRLDTRHVTPT